MKVIPVHSRVYGYREILVDDEDYESIVRRGRWHVMKSKDIFYARRTFQVANVWGRELMHVFLLGQKGVDHIDGNGLNNLRSNLRPATDRENAQNRRVRSDNVSGYRGVARTRSGTWLAYAHSDGKQVYGGCHSTPEAAAVAARELRARLMPYVNERRLPQPESAA